MTRTGYIIYNHFRIYKEYTNLFLIMFICKTLKEKGGVKTSRRRSLGSILRSLRCSVPPSPETTHRTSLSCRSSPPTSLHRPFSPVPSVSHSVPREGETDRSTTTSLRRSGPTPGAPTEFRMVTWSCRSRWSNTRCTITPTGSTCGTECDT